MNPIKSILSCLILTIIPGLVLGAQDSIPLYQESSEVNIPFDIREKTFTTGAMTVLDVQELLRYDNPNTVQDMIRGRVPGITSGFNLYGLGNALIVIDGIPRPASSVNIEEVEQITVLKDASAAMLYGSQAKNGVVFITTRKGVPHKPKSTISLEQGFGKPISYPEYLGAADYMELFNEARVNDNLEKRYSDIEITNTRNGSDPIRYPDVDYFTSEYLRNYKPETRLLAELSGGNDVTQYFVSAGWLRSGTLLNIGEGKSENSDRLNVRANVDFRINDFIKSSINVVALYDLSHGAIGNFWNDATALLPNYYAPLIDTALVTNKEMLESAKIIDGKYILGGTSQYRNSVYGNLMVGGYKKSKNSTAQFSNAIDFDLGSILKGLSLKTYISFDFYNQYTILQDNEYAVYQPVFTSIGGIEALDLTKIGTDRFKGTQGISNTANMRRIATFGVLNYQRNFNERHALTAKIISYGDKYSRTAILHDNASVHVGAGINYILDNKYIVDFNSTLINSTKLAPGNRVGFSPSLAFSWVISNEDFLSQSSAINFLKLIASAGVLNTDENIPGYYLYKDYYAERGQTRWADGTYFNNMTRYENVGNNGLFFEKRKSISVGVEAGFLDNSLSLDANFFHESYTDQIVKRNKTTTSLYGGFLPYENFEADKYSGIDFGLRFRKASNNFKYEAGVSMVYLQTEVLKRDESNLYDYQNQTGKSVGAIYGLEAIGLFANQDDITGHELQYFGMVSPGDIKYKDQNGDGNIDENDLVMIGKNIPDISGGFDLTLQYKNLSFFALVTGSSGSDKYYNDSYYQVYGERKYSKEVLGRWQNEETGSMATYPRLSSGSNSNNYRISDYWLYSVSGLSIDRIQLSYDLPSVAGKLAMKQFGLYLRASNVARFAKNRDRLDLRIGSEPQYQYYMIGLKAIF